MANSTTQIGKDVIESLTLGMYDDARIIFREYIQNSADQIDQAVEGRLFLNKQEGKIEIDINELNKTISFFDNATGIKSDEVELALKNIAKSSKDRAKNKGFRGLGRLGGLAYADKLVFETSFKGEDVKSFLVWDAKKLKNIINNREQKEDAVSVIDSITQFRTEAHKTDSHYFKVSLTGVNNKSLLDRKDVYQYLSMVAPVPYSKGFLFKDKIIDKANELNYPIDEYQIFIKNEQIFKAYTTSIYEGSNGNKKKIDEVYDIETYEIRDTKDGLLAWGWYSLSNLTKVMPAINYARGLRLRKGNIQIGLENALNKLFKEDRGSNYFFGEIHVISPNLIPNARRDYFLENSDLEIFEKQIDIKFSELHKLYYFSSTVRNEKKKVDNFYDFSNDYQKKCNTGFSDKTEEEKYQNDFSDKQEKASTAKEKLKKIKNNNDSKVKQKLYQKIIGNEKQNTVDISTIQDDKKTKYITDDISALSRKDKKLVSKIFGVIDIILTPDISELLKQKIKEELQ